MIGLAISKAASPVVMAASVCAAKKVLKTRRPQRRREPPAILLGFGLGCVLQGVHPRRATLTAVRNPTEPAVAKEFRHLRKLRAFSRGAAGEWEGTAVCYDIRVVSGVPFAVPLAIPEGSLPRNFEDWMPEGGVREQQVLCSVQVLGEPLRLRRRVARVGVEISDGFDADTFQVENEEEVKVDATGQGLSCFGDGSFVFVWPSGEVDVAGGTFPLSQKEGMQSVELCMRIPSSASRGMHGQRVRAVFTGRFPDNWVRAQISLEVQSSKTFLAGADVPNAISSRGVPGLGHERAPPLRLGERLLFGVTSPRAAGAFAEESEQQEVLLREPPPPTALQLPGDVQLRVGEVKGGFQLELAQYCSEPIAVSSAPQDSDKLVWRRLLRAQLHVEGGGLSVRETFLGWETEALHGRFPCNSGQ